MCRAEWVAGLQVHREGCMCIICKQARRAGKPWGGMVEADGLAWQPPPPGGAAPEQGQGLTATPPVRTDLGERVLCVCTPGTCSPAKLCRLQQRWAVSRVQQGALGRTLADVPCVRLHECRCGHRQGCRWTYGAATLWQAGLPVLHAPRGGWPQATYGATSAGLAEGSCRSGAMPFAAIWPCTCAQACMTARQGWCCVSLQS